jgi:hypothetical protein
VRGFQPSISIDVTIIVDEDKGFLLIHVLVTICMSLYFGEVMLIG